MIIKGVLVVMGGVHIVQQEVKRESIRSQDTQSNLHLGIFPSHRFRRNSLVQ